MKYLKKIFEHSNSDEIKEISLNIFKYMNDFEWTSNHYNLNDVLVENLDDADIDSLSLDQIEDAVSYIIENKTTAPRTYNGFYDQYYEALEFISSHNINIDEIEDLFLDYKCKVYKSTSFFQGYQGKYSIPSFKTELYTDSNKISSLFSTIWNVIGKRLPNEYKIKDVLIRNKDNNEILVNVLIEGPKKLVE